MDNTEVWTHILAMVLAFAMPPIVAFIKTPATPRLVALSIVLALSVAVGAISGVITGQIDVTGLSIDSPETILTAAAAAFTEATVFYQAWFRETSLNATLEKAGWTAPPDPSALMGGSGQMAPDVRPRPPMPPRAGQP